MSFTPQFVDFVQGIAPNGVTFGISSNYCLSKPSAVELLKLLNIKADIVDGPPVPNRGNRFQYTQMVPFFRFADGKVRNAGVLATYWVWFQGDMALRAAKADVEDDYTGEELL
jgi:hypothetical protein